jgi:ACR3 family arsenite transporter
MWNHLTKLKQNLPLSLTLVILLGSMIGLLSSVQWFSKLIIPLTIMMIYPMMITIDVKHLLTRHDLSIYFGAFLVNFIFIPLLGFFLGFLFLQDQPGLYLGLLLMAALPTSSMTITWTGFSKGNVAEAIKLTILGLLLGSLVAPFLVATVLGSQVTFSLISVVQKIILIVFVPILLGLLTRTLLVKKHGIEHFNANLKAKFPLISILGILGIIFIAVALKIKSIVANPLILINVLVPLLLFYGVGFLVSLLYFKFYKYEDAVALAFATPIRNLSVAIGIAATSFGDEGALASVFNCSCIYSPGTECFFF